MKKELTNFQWKVLRATLKIPLGETRSYAWVAKQIGSPAAVRAVGTALKKNPYPVIIPCHRVIKSSGSLGMYMGKSSHRKKELLDQEQKIVKMMNQKNK
ncbi:Methylated-DNA--protein-cysteine methyltransferase [hydrothermal vent metagenome]|uniref:methylated-DNA--[protein]-cysteine S-methyltransferase n=1 Tax=hydrothermal vent metagenome TaxID=652676 RepID=A0A3B0T340_9ZZZZ